MTPSPAPPCHAPTRGPLLPLVVVLAALLPAPGTRAVAAQEAFPPQVFAGHATGTTLHAGVAETVGGPRVVEVDVGVSAASVDARGLRSVLDDEMGRAVHPASGPGEKSYGGGAGVRSGVRVARDAGVDVRLAGSAGAAAPPSRPLATDELAPVDADPVVSASLARSQAHPLWSDTSCVVGQPLAFGLGHAADVEVLGLPTGAGAGTVPPSVAVTGAGAPPDRRTFQSRSFTYLTPNREGTFALVSETRQTIAPVTLFPGTPQQVTVEVLGELVLRATAGGVPGGAVIEYAPAGSPSPSTPVVRIVAGGQLIELTVQQVFGPGGVHLPAGPWVELALGEPPRAPNSASGPGGGDAAPAERAADGTVAAAAVDVLRLTLLDPPAAGPAGVADVRLGHMEVRASVPRGGVRCHIPVLKVATPEFVNPGETFRWTISIPARRDAVDGLSCDLVDLRAVDTATATKGVRFTLLSASGGGVIDGTTVTWPRLPPYHPGDPPIVVTVAGRLDPDSIAGGLANVVQVTARLDRCTGGDTGQPLKGLTDRQPAALHGRFALRGPHAGAS